ncbi:hypothetical protein WH35_00595, partial [Wolbachia endosymbiont of Drosophila incompta]
GKIPSGGHSTFFAGENASNKKTGSSQALKNEQKNTIKNTTSERINKYIANLSPCFTMAV